MSSRVVEVVVVGNGTKLDSNDVPHVIPTAAVPVIEIRNTSPSTGEPLKLVVKVFMAAV